MKLQVPISLSQCALLLPKNKKYPFIPRIALLFSRIVLLFSRSILLFLGSAFLFLKNALLFSRIAQKMPYCFPELPFSFPEVFYLLCACFSKNALFLADCTFSSSCSELLREMIFAFVFVLFPLGTYDVFLITLKPLHGI